MFEAMLYVVTALTIVLPVRAASGLTRPTWRSLRSGRSSTREGAAVVVVGIVVVESVSARAGIVAERRARRVDTARSFMLLV